MATTEHFRLFGRYNAWANGRLYAAAAGLDEAEYRRDRRGFFRSLHGTLNHVLVADRIWLRRITGEGEAVDRLDAILFEDLAELRAAREREDARIRGLVDGLDAARLQAALVYRNTAGTPFEQPLWQVLAHVFNHQTHHRGQAHDMLSQAGAAPPVLDLLYYMREN